MIWAEATREAFYSAVWRTVLDDHGRRIVKFPNDLYVYRELIRRLKPQVIVETGTAEGGSAAFFAEFAPVISVDLQRPERPDERVCFVVGDSTSPDTLAEVTRLVDGRSCLVSLDSAHYSHHVRAEVQAYAPFVPIGGYLVIEDTAIDAYGIESQMYPDGGPGVVAKELVEAGMFEADTECERFGLGMNPGGWLRRLR